MWLKRASRGLSSRSSTLSFFGLAHKMAAVHAYRAGLPGRGRRFQGIVWEPLLRWLVNSLGLGVGDRVSLVIIDGDAFNLAGSAPQSSAPTHLGEFDCNNTRLAAGRRGTKKTTWARSYAGTGSGSISLMKRGRLRKSGSRGDDPTTGPKDCRNTSAYGTDVEYLTTPVTWPVGAFPCLTEVMS